MIKKYGKSKFYDSNKSKKEIKKIVGRTVDTRKVISIKVGPNNIHEILDEIVPKHWKFERRTLFLDMKKIGEFIFPWGNGHYSRMMKLDEVLPKYLTEEYEMFYFSKGDVYKKLLKKFPDRKKNIYEILMPTPIDGKSGPSVSLSILNMFFPVGANQSLVNQVKNYLK